MYYTISNIPNLTFNKIRDARLFVKVALEGDSTIANIIKGEIGINGTNIIKRHTKRRIKYFSYR
jgi:hypothetical protein